MKGDEFGYSINQLDGLLVIGSPNKDYGGVEMVGGTYLFTQTENYQFIQDEIITYYISSTSTRFGCNLASYDNLLLIGGCFLDSTCITDYLFIFLFFPLPLLILFFCL